MRAEYQELNERLEAMSREELILSFRRILEECSEKDAQLEITADASKEMSVQYQQIRDENNALKKKNKELLKQNRELTEYNCRLEEQLEMRKKDLFGRKSEQTSGIMNSILNDEQPEDPLEEITSEEAADAGNTNAEPEEQDRVYHAKREHHGKKTPGKRAADMSKLPQRTEYDLDIEDLNRRYGEGNWRIAFWHKEETIESAHTMQYHKVKFVPVVSVGLEHDLVSPYPCSKILPGSYASSSLVAEMLYQKYVQCIPAYRMEADFNRSGVAISRQTIVSLMNRFALQLLVLAARYMESLLLQRSHNQCDETHLMVIRDMRSPGRKSFMWVHTTSELDQDHPIVVFGYELTRATTHLRDFYKDNGYHGVITCDAYASYLTLEKEAEGITTSGCWMHARRRFSYAAQLIRGKKLSEQEILTLPEMQALALIDAINEADKPLKEMAPEERLSIRKDEVTKRVDAYFAYIKTLDTEDPAYSEKLKDAISYSLNQEDKLRAFLKDPMVPIDNGFCERHIKPFATGRRNWLFSYSMDGAEASAIIYTLAETARANDAHPYYYLKYLIETLSNKTTSKDNGFLDDCMPWSDAYREYEAREKEASLRFIADQVPPEAPKTPRKRKASA